MKLTACVTVIVTIVFATGTTRADPTRVSRDVIAKDLSAATILRWSAPDIPLSNKKIDARIAGRIDELARELLPVLVECPDEQALHRLTSQPLFLDFNDEAYIDLSIRVELLEIKTSLQYQLRFPFSAEQQKAVEDSITPVIDDIQKQMHEHLTGAYPLFTNAEIDKQVEVLKSQIFARIADRDSYWLKLPLKKAEADHFLSDFTERLKASVGQVAKRIEHDAKDSNGKLDSREAGFVRSQILIEMTYPIEKSIEKSTTDPSRMVDVSLESAPQLHGLQGDLWRMRLRLSRTSGSDPGNRQ